jgi:predicted MPP superfamily phosphohydrolase
LRLWPWIPALTAACVGTLVYGAVGAANQLVIERRRLRLPLWPERLNGYRIGLLADLHIRDEFSVKLCARAVDAILKEDPDVVVIAGDFVASYRPNSPELLAQVLGPFKERPGYAIGVPGNHDYWDGDPRLLKPVLDELGIVLLRNEVLRRDGVTFVGIDSVNAFAADPFSTMASVEAESPIIAIWHEPDMVEHLPRGAALMLSGHSHGGQFRFPWGWTPMHTMHGEIYVEGFFPDAPTPIYVSRGIGTTGPPSRLGVLPEVAILTLVSYATSA